MELITGIKGRRSIRKFEDKKVPRELVKEIIDAARFAPSWKNTQTVRYIAIDDRETIEKVASSKCTYGFDFNIKTILAAPMLVIVTVKEGISGFDKDGSFSTKKEDRWQTFDAGIATEAFCLAAYEKGLGTVIQGYFDEDEIKKVVEIPEGQQIAALIPMGYPAVSPEAPARKEVSDLVTFI